MVTCYMSTLNDHTCSWDDSARVPGGPGTAPQRRIQLRPIALTSVSNRVRKVCGLVGIGGMGAHAAMGHSPAEES